MCSKGWAKVKAYVKRMAIMARFEIMQKAAQAQEEAQLLLNVGGIVTAVENAADLENVAFWQQGDASLATKEKLAERQALRYHPLVLDALQKYWEAAQRSLQSGGDPSANELHREGHALMLRRIYRVMIKDFDPADCERCIAEDWARDAKGKDTLTRKSFCDAFFELAGEDPVVVQLLPACNTLTNFHLTGCCARSVTYVRVQIHGPTTSMLVSTRHSCGPSSIRCPSRNRSSAQTAR